jgi:anti-anti-sigma factor
MEITKQNAGQFMELVIKGRLDGYWADHLTSALEEVVRGGADHVRLNLAGVSYISSLGIRVLLKVYQQLNGINGALVVSNPSEPVKRVLEMMHLGKLLVSETVDPALASVPETGRRIDRKTTCFEVFDCAPNAKLECAVVGNPALLSSCGFRNEHSRTMTFAESAMAIGLGAFGHHFEDCEQRFGEFLSVAGAAAYQPTDGSNVPDYLIAEGSFIPELQVLYALVCKGHFASLARFEANSEARAVPLSDLADAALEISGAATAGIAMIAESAGLIGAALRQAPTQSAFKGEPFHYPEARRWLSFSPEHSHMRSLAVIAGVASRIPDGPLAPMLRPVGPGSSITGHFHAAAFSYRPIQKGRVDLKTTIKSVFEAETLQGVLHLLADDRESAAVAQSEFVRGSCWISPIVEVA